MRELRVKAMMVIIISDCKEEEKIVSSYTKELNFTVEWSTVELSMARMPICVFLYQLNVMLPSLSSLKPLSPISLLLSIFYVL